MTLTPRQQEILKRVATGQLYKEVAHDLGISENGVARHVDNMRLALKVKSTAELTHYALAKGLVRNLFS